MPAQKKTTRTVEVDGVSVEVDTRRLNDVRFTYFLGKVTSSHASEEERMAAYSGMLDVLFDDPYKIMCDLAKPRGGHLDADAFNAFFMKVIEELGAKN